jgi:cardiolipin synthase A/B
MTSPLVHAVLGPLLAVDLLLLVQVVLAVRSRRRKQPFRAFPHPDLPPVSVGANDLTLYTYGEALYAAMLAAIDSAQESIYLETFIWKDDAVGEAFKEQLARKAAAGVAVYVIYDRLANLVVPPAFKRFPSPIHTLRFQAIRRPWHLLDPHRHVVDHRKLLVVDGRIAFLGGYNLGSLYATKWRDTHVGLRGPVAGDLAQAFVDFWNRHAPRTQHIRRQYPATGDARLVVQTTDARRGRYPIRRMYLAAIERAEHTIRLTNAYFVPSRRLLTALKAAAQRGVEVEILVPRISNHRVVDWVTRGYFTECLAAGIRVSCYQGAMIHAKTCTIDGHWSTIGTANLDRLSLVGNYEINLEIESPALARHMETIFAADQTNASLLTVRGWAARPWYVKLSERLLAPLRGFL